MEKSIAGEGIPYNLYGIKLPEMHLARLPDLYRNIITGFCKKRHLLNGQSKTG